jgi:membrane protease YdiL (CAAX protease family)
MSASPAPPPYLGIERPSRHAAALEIALVIAFTVGHRVLRVIPVDETILVLALGWISLWRRGVGWRGVGLTRPPSWPRAVAVGVAVGVMLQVLSEYVSEPLIEHLTGQRANLEGFRSLVGNERQLALYLVLVWTWAAFGEELAYRGYLLNRAADLVGRTPAGWSVAVVFVTGLFGFGHSYQGLAGMLDTGLHGLILCGVYLASGRNLWPVILAHGVTDTVAIGLLYSGVGVDA